MNTFSSDRVRCHVTCEVVSFFEVLTTHLALESVSVSLPFKTTIFLLAMMAPHVEY